MSRLSGYYYEGTWNPGATSAEITSTTITVPGTKQGDFVLASYDSIGTGAAGNVIMGAWATADDTVVVSLIGDSTGTDPGAGTLRVKVIPIDAI